MHLPPGAELLPETEVIAPIIENGFVVGIRYLGKDDREEELHAKVVGDASGIRAVIRDKLPREIYEGEKLLPEDTVGCYREVRELTGKSGITPDSSYPGWYCTLQNHGYFWVVPEQKKLANIGCGLPHFPDNPDPEKLTQEYCAKHSTLFGEKIYAKGTGPTPLIPMRA